MKKFTVLKNVLMLAILFTGGTAIAQNLVKNPSFEEWADGKPVAWSVYDGTCVQETTDVMDASSAARMSMNVKVGQYVNGISENAQYTITMDYKIVNAGDKPGQAFRPWLRWQRYVSSSDKNWVDPINDAEKQKMQGDYVADNTGNWSKYSLTVTAPATTTTIHVDLRAYNNSEVIVDNVSVVKAGGSSIANLEKANRIYANGGVVTINTENNGIAEVYNLLGQRVMNFQIKAGDNNLNGLAKGQIYMVKFAGKTQKVVL